MAEHAISFRAPDAEEQRRLTRQAQWPAGTLAVGGTIGCGGTFIASMVVVVVLDWLLRKFGSALTQTAAVSIMSGGVIFGLVVAARMGRDLHQQFQRHRRARAESQVQRLHVIGARVVEREAYNSEGPLYFFDVGNSKVLLVKGQWLFDMTRDGTPSDDQDVEIDEALPLFPAETFIIERYASSGEVLSIRAEGDRLNPERRIPWKERMPPWADKGLSDLRNSILLDGHFEELVTPGRTK